MRARSRPGSGFEGSACFVVQRAGLMASTFRYKILFINWKVARKGHAVCVFLMFDTGFSVTEVVLCVSRICYRSGVWKYHGVKGFGRSCMCLLRKLGRKRPNGTERETHLSRNKGKS